jgi:hypothetical protein
MKTVKVLRKVPVNDGGVVIIRHRLLADLVKKTVIGKL